MQACKAERWDLPQIAHILLLQREGSGVYRSLEDLKRMLADPSWTLFVVRNDQSEVVAFGTLQERDGVFRTVATASHPHKRISGAVRAVNQARYDEILKRGGDAIFGAIKAGNKTALAFWLKEGWEVLSQNENWIQVVRRLARNPHSGETP